MSTRIFFPIVVAIVSMAIGAFPAANAVAAICAGGGNCG